MIVSNLSTPGERNEFTVHPHTLGEYLLFCPWGVASHLILVTSSSSLDERLAYSVEVDGLPLARVALL